VSAPHELFLVVSQFEILGELCGPFFSGLCGLRILFFLSQKDLDRKVREEKSAMHANRLEDVQIKRISPLFFLLIARISSSYNLMVVITTNCGHQALGYPG